MMPANEKFEFIHETLADPANSFTSDSLCRALEVSRSGYCSWLASAQNRAKGEEQSQHDFDLIIQAFKAHGHSKGARSIQLTLLHSDPPVHMNLKKIRRLMKKYSLFCTVQGPNPYRSIAIGMRVNQVAPNLLRKEFELQGPRSVLRTDIGYAPYKNGTAYLSTILDAYTKQILAYRISRSLEVDFVLDTVEDLLENHGSELNTDVMLHSDQGCHYTSHKFVDLLQDRNLRQSMSRKGNCWDNAVQESFFGHMKDHIKDRGRQISSFEEAKAEIAAYIEYYNKHRCQWKLATLSPNEFYRYVTAGVYPISGVEPAAIGVKQLALPAAPNGTAIKDQPQ